MEKQADRTRATRRTTEQAMTNLSQSIALAVLALFLTAGELPAREAE
jgi:hypothetical protein